MKNILLTAIILSLAVPASASISKKTVKQFKDHINDESLHKHTAPYDGKEATDTKLGIKADAPNLIKITQNSSVGAEVSKDLRDTAADEGWAFWAKYTYSGSLLDFSN